MIDQPVKLDMYAHLGEALQLFRLHHMRHLLVVSPLDGSLAGIITRKDLNAFMNYWRKEKKKECHKMTTKELEHNS